MDEVTYSNDWIQINGLFRWLKNSAKAGVDDFDLDIVLQGELLIISGVPDDLCIDTHGVIAYVFPILWEKLELIRSTGVNPTLLGH